MIYTIMFRHSGYNNEVIITPISMEADSLEEAMQKAVKQVPFYWEMVDSRLATEPYPAGWAAYVIFLVILLLAVLWAVL